MVNPPSNLASSVSGATHAVGLLPCALVSQSSCRTCKIVALGQRGRDTAIRAYVPLTANHSARSLVSADESSQLSSSGRGVSALALPPMAPTPPLHARWTGANEVVLYGVLARVSMLGLRSDRPVGASSSLVSSLPTRTDGLSAAPIATTHLGAHLHVRRRRIDSGAAVLGDRLREQVRHLSWCCVHIVPLVRPD
ncbi:hypothetical protein B0H15DRAFT_947361 [Mycena belliarum]|uniref:Uncharacterized protein n=1 Tax=Mycena belliarum TaxID=1033014 RepID=A0AAD6U7Q8_9AGAR|nr:hypothetical protein B0H15DRAFT_947361 [Mycena belliae]